MGFVETRDGFFFFGMEHVISGLFFMTELTMYAGQVVLKFMVLVISNFLDKINNLVCVSVVSEFRFCDTIDIKNSFPRVEYYFYIRI